MIKLLVREFNLIDIKKYESETGNNILSFFKDIKLSNIVDLIRLGNGYCDEDRAYRILDYYLELEDNTLMSAILEIKEKLLGIGNEEDNDVDEEDKIDISKFESLTDLYIHFSMQLMSVGLSYSEFWGMNTKEMYKVFNSIAIKMQNETNRELSNYHVLAAMVGGAVWGKLQKEPPKVNYANVNDNRDLDVEDAIMVAKLKDFVKRYNKKEE